jgi:DedD protein
VERHVKERLVGAAVLMAAAIILIPEMLSGPDRQMPASNEQSAAGNVKTYTIDLGASSSQSQPPNAIESAPPPETVAASPPSSATSSSSTPPIEPRAEPQTSPEPTELTGSSAVVPQSEPAREPVGDVRQLPTPQPQPSPARETGPRALVSESPIPTTKGWAVQLGSFSHRESAERLVREFQAERFDAFVMPVKSGSGTLYRVRLGPMQDRAVAQEALKRAKVKVAGAALVAHP